jgi:HopA1 effector protein family
MNKQIISQIVGNKLIINSLQQFMNQYPYHSLSSESQENMVLQLGNLIYQKFYINSKELNLKKENLITKLKKANKSKSMLHRGFTIDFILANGNLIAQKDDSKILVKPGQYILLENIEPRLNQQILIHKPHEIYEPENDFYFVYGTTLDEDFHEAKLRIYFNLSPSGVPLLVESITTLFNKNNIPFTFKCLYETAKYGRSDACVLYFDKRYFSDFKTIWKEIYLKIEKLLSSNIPLFTLKIQLGVGLAENPKSNNSFGKERCSLIAQGIFESFNQQISTDERYQFVLQYIASQGYDIDNFYLNPKSPFRYGL